MMMNKKVSIVDERLEIAKRNTQAKFKIFNECDAIYHGSGKQQFTNSQIHNPYSWSNVETIVPRMVAKSPTIVYRPREESDEETSETHTALFDYWWDIDGAFRKIVALIKDGLIYGTGVAKVYWKTVEKEITTYIYDQTGRPVLDENGDYLVETRKVKAHDDPTLENVNIYDFFIDPEASELQDANWVIHRYWKTLDALEQAPAGIYKNIRTLKRYLSNNTAEERSTEEKTRREYAYGQQVENDSTVDKVEIWEMWDKDGLTVVAAGNVVIREQANPFWHGKKPFIVFRDSVVPNEFYGKGEIEPVKKLQYTLDTIQNQIIDNRTQILMNMWKVKGENVDESELVYRPNGIIHVSSEFEDVLPITPVDVTRNASQDLALVKSDIQQALGIYDYSKGGESQTNKTATGISLVQEAANARFAHKIQLFEEALKELGNFILSLYQQFVTDEKVIRVVGEKGVEYKRIIPSEIAGEYDCEPEAGSTQPINKEAEREDILNLYSIFAQEPYQQLNTELKREILKKFGMETLVGAFDEDLKQMEEAQAQQAQMMEQQQMMEQEQQMQPPQSAVDPEAVAENDRQQELAHLREQENLLLKAELTDRV